MPPAISASDRGPGPVALLRRGAVLEAALDRAPRIRLRGDQLAHEGDRAVEALLDERLGERLLRREVAVDGADADAGAARDVLHLRLGAVLGERCARGLQHLRAVADRVSAETSGDDRGLDG